MAFTPGEILEKFILPTLVHNLANTKQDFLSVIPNAPQRAISKAGIVVHKVGNPISVDWDKVDEYVDGDIVRFDVENDLIPWQQFSTTPFATDKEEIRTSMLNRGGILAQKAQEAITVSWIEKNLHNLAPDDDTDAVYNPVLEPTGADRGDGNKKLLVVDLTRFLVTFTKMGLLRMDQLYVILTPEQWGDLMQDALTYQAFRDMFIKTMNGEPIPHHGFKFFVNNFTVKYAVDGTKKAIGAAPVGTDKAASVIFYAPHTIKAIGNVTPHYKPMSQDTRNNPPMDEARWTGNATVGKIWKVGFGAIKDVDV